MTKETEKIENPRRLGLDKYKIVDTTTGRIIEKFRSKNLANHYFKKLNKLRNNIKLVDINDIQPN